MAIFRGIGGAGDSTTDATLTAVTQQAVNAVNSASSAATSATQAATSASEAATSATQAATSAANASASATTASAAVALVDADALAAAASAAAAATSETEAAASATSAATSETNASSAASNAAISASDAATSATAAATSATAADVSKVAAEAAQSATEALFTQFGDQYLGSKATAPTVDNSGNPLDEGDVYWDSTNNVLKFYTGSAWVAPEDIATTAASNASSSASAAATSATNAATSATTAATSASAAAASETNAASSASSASTSATAASVSETNAATSATNASSSQTAAASSATDALASKNAAAASASSASTSETNAAASASAASASEAAAAASYDAFDDRYLGSKTSEPSLDNDGNALLVGALYFDTTLNLMKVYDGSTWLTAYASSGGALLNTNNLSDVFDVSTSRTNLGLGTGSDVVFNSLETTDGLTVGGNLTVNGTLTTVNTENLAVSDNMIYLNDGSTVTNPDLGWAGNYNDGTYAHAGIFRDATDGVFKFYDGYTLEPGVEINTGDASFNLANVAANSFTGSLVGNASTASALTTARTIELTGDVTGSTTFDGSGNVAITTAVGDDSHSHSTSTITGLDAALASYAPLASPGLTGTPTSPTAAVGTNTTQVATTAFVNAQIANDAPTKTGGGASGTWDISITGNAATATSATTATTATTATNATSATTAVSISTDRSNWSTNGTISAVVGQLAWKNYGNNHTIFDASQGTSPSGTAVNNTDPAVGWSGSYPTLMGWNGSSTYGVRVDVARYSNAANGKWASAYIAGSQGSNVSAVEVRNNGGTGDSNLANITFHCTGYYGTSLHLRPDGYFGLGGWSASSWRWYVYLPNGDMTAAGNVTAYSDPRLKENVKKIDSALDIVDQLDGVRFTWKHGIQHVDCKAGKEDIGVLADQVEEVLPEIVSNGIEIEGEQYKTVAYDKLVPVLIEAIKELRAEINTLKGI